MASESTRLRARQNVLYELGYFAGKYWYSRRASTKDVQILLSYCIPSLMNMAAGNANC
ncbi:TIR domain-containing protein [Salmonella enterica subsp. enterica serovar Rissen]